VMLDVMYDAPSQKQIKEVLITEDAILGKHAPSESSNKTRM